MSFITCWLFILSSYNFFLPLHYIFLLFFFLLFSIVFSWNLKKNPELYLSIRAKHINKIVQTGIIKMKYPIFGSFLTCLEYWVGNPEIKQVILFCFKSPICQMGIIITILYHDFFHWDKGLISVLCFDLWMYKFSKW